MKYFLLLLTLLLFSIKGIISLDPDFGWHLRSGEIILDQGIPLKDPFSYSMPGYNFVNHEWLTGVLFAILYPIFGMIGLSVVFAVIAVFAVLIQLRGFWTSQNDKYFVTLAILALTAVLSVSGVRPQIISWLFFSLVLKIALDSKLWNRLRWFLPLLFLIWANLHGGFVIGIAVLFFVVVLRFTQEYLNEHSVLGYRLSAFRSRFIGVWSAGLRQTDKLKTENRKYEILILLLSVLATLLNPYGFSLWKETWAIASDSSLRWSIAEWTPSIFILDFTLWFFFSFSGVLVFRYRKNFSFLELFLYFGLLLSGLSSIRNMPLWIIMAFPMTLRAIGYLYDEAKSKKDGVSRFNKAYRGFFVIVLLISTMQIFLILKASQTLSEESYYPKRATEFLKKQKHSQIFSEYGWGGYLVWKQPGKRFFINGSMTVWRQKTQNNKESEYAFGEYKNVFGGKISFKEISGKYNIDTVLLPVKKPENKKKKFLEDLDLWWNKIIERFSGKRIYPDIYTQLKNEGWKVVYQDEVAMVYRK